MELVNEISRMPDDPAGRLAAETAVSLIQPWAPHVAEELWEHLGRERMWAEPWPIADQAQIGFVNKSGRLQRLPRLLLSQTLGSQQAQLIVYQREQLGRCVWIAGIDGVCNVGTWPRAQSALRGDSIGE